MCVAEPVAASTADLKTMLLHAVYLYDNFFPTIHFASPNDYRFEAQFFVTPCPFLSHSPSPRKKNPLLKKGDSVFLRGLWFER